ncbi:MAG: hypothetical protein WKF68_13805 [Daejeonella sp.]
MLVDKYGVIAKDGCVDISTKNTKIIYIGTIEKENLQKISSISKSVFYNRLELKNEDGSLYDQIYINPTPGGSVSATLNHQGGAAFYINGKISNEEQVRSNRALIVSLKGEGSYGVGGAKNYSVSGYELSKYELLFWFKDEPSWKDIL